MDLYDVLLVDEDDVTDSYERKAKDPIIRGDIHYVLLSYLHCEFTILSRSMLKVEPS